MKYNIDMEELERICEGESNAQLMLDCLNEVYEQFPNSPFGELKERICTLWANYLRGFYTEGQENSQGDELSIEEHWQINYDWGMEILDDIKDLPPVLPGTLS